MKPTGSMPGIVRLTREHARGTSPLEWTKVRWLWSGSGQGFWSGLQGDFDVIGRGDFSSGGGGSGSGLTCRQNSATCDSP